jgi:hypothetical protein
MKASGGKTALSYQKHSGNEQTDSQTDTLPLSLFYIISSPYNADVSVASRRLCFMCVVQRHDQTSLTDREANPQSSEGHHTHTHTQTHHLTSNFSTFSKNIYT